MKALHAHIASVREVCRYILCCFGQVAPNKVYLGIKDRPAEPGMQLNFYGAYTMEKTGEATITEVARNEDVAINQAFWDALNKAHCLTWNVVPWLITLDRDIKISELEVVDTAQASLCQMLSIRFALKKYMALVKEDGCLSLRVLLMLEHGRFLPRLQAFLLHALNCNRSSMPVSAAGTSKGSYLHQQLHS